jgi:7-cyano-7-deazaguanine synthase
MESPTKKTILIYSGGVDSTTLLYFLLSQGHEVNALGVNYGQRHLKELDAAQEICASLGIDFRVADLSSLKPLLTGSALTSEQITVPKGHYASDSMKITVVPNRNMLMLAVAIAWAISSRYDSVAYAAHAGDHAIYPDCRPEFVRALEEAARLCHYDPIEILTPFIHKTKAEIVKIGHDLKVPFHLTWSCYCGQEIHCGKCGTCTERAEAFMLAHVPDPTRYASTPALNS